MGKLFMVLGNSDYGTDAIFGEGWCQKGNIV